MASELRRAAQALVERHTERFESRHPLAQSQQRFEQALRRAQLASSPTFVAAWTEVEGRAILDAEFLPASGTLRALKLMSLGMLLLVVASVWVLRMTDPGPERYLLPLFTGLAILGLPFVALGLASARQAREARIRKAIRVALLDEDAQFPAQRKWADED